MWAAFWRYCFPLLLAFHAFSLRLTIRARARCAAEVPPPPSDSVPFRARLVSLNIFTLVAAAAVFP